MSASLAHIVHTHDPKLVVMAAVVAFCGSVIAVRLYSRLRGSRGMVRTSWTMLTALVAGSGAWAAHFLTMLAFMPSLTTGYRPGSTLGSLFTVVSFMAAGFALASSQRTSANQVAGGVLIGFGVAAMHYVGMTGMAFQGHVVWDNSVVGASVAVGVIGATVAVLWAGDGRRVREQLIAGSLLTIAILSLHFTGMSAMAVVLDPATPIAPGLLTRGVMTMGVTTMAAMIIMGGLGAALIETAATNSALERIRRLADAAYEGIVVIREDRINDCNAAFCELAGASVHQLRGRRLAGELLSFQAGDGLPREGEYGEAQLHPLSGGREVPVEVFARLMDDGERHDTAGLTVLAVRDLRERRAAEEKIRYLAEHDALTGLPNRNALRMRLDAALERVEASKESLALLCIDIDHFKEANDLHGHHAGDALLTEVGRRLQKAVRAPSFAARLGGDEFMVVQVSGGDQAAAAAELASQILEVLREPVALVDQVVQVGASIGIALFPHDGRTGEALLANSDMALFRAKEGGRDAYRFFKRDMDDTIRERRSLVRELRQAITAGELVLHYQPLARATDGEVCGFEALVRWNHPQRGLVPPLSFIPLAEESGLIVPLGEWALRNACETAASWERPLRVAVNLSPLQLHQPSLPALVETVLKETGLEPGRLELEITEGALFEDHERALEHLRALKALGVRIAMDDFGTGFSSLSTLQSFPFDKIKIDKSFVENIDKDARAKVIVRAVLGLGRSLEIPVVAEGVETPAQLEFLRGESCAEVQGYLIGRPAPAADIAGWTGKAAPPISISAARKRRTSAA